jgi:hypothetical protein
MTAWIIGTRLSISLGKLTPWSTDQIPSTEANSRSTNKIFPTFFRTLSSFISLQRDLLKEPSLEESFKIMMFRQVTLL